MFEKNHFKSFYDLKDSVMDDRATNNISAEVVVSEKWISCKLYCVIEPFA